MALRLKIVCSCDVAFLTFQNADVILDGPPLEISCGVLDANTHQAKVVKLTKKTLSISKTAGDWSGVAVSVNCTTPTDGTRYLNLHVERGMQWDLMITLDAPGAGPTYVGPGVSDSRIPF